MSNLIKDNKTQSIADRALIFRSMGLVERHSSLCNHSYYKPSVSMKRIQRRERLKRQKKRLDAHFSRIEIWGEYPIREGGIRGIKEDADCQKDHRARHWDLRQNTVHWNHLNSRHSRIKCPRFFLFLWGFLQNPAYSL